MPRVISQGNIPNLINDLKKSHDLFAPMVKGEEVIFDRVEDPMKVMLSYKTTLLPPKIFFLPPEEELFKVTNGLVQEERTGKPFIVFGLSRKDLEAIVYLDQIMAKKPADTFY